jgi:hypothetical protein
MTPENPAVREHAISAQCELCSQRIDADFITGGSFQPGDGVAWAIAYDQLALKMWFHISEVHPLQMQEGMRAQQRAAKMYAMNWAKIDPKFEQLRKQYRAELLIAMTVTTKIEPAQATAPGAAGSGGAGSN